MPEKEEKHILTFYRGEEDIVVNETKNYMASIFRDQYTHALLQIHQLVSNKKNDVPSIVAFCGDRGEGKTSCMETVKTMLEAMNNQDESKEEVKKAVDDFMKQCGITQTKEDLRCKNFEKTRFKVLNTIDPAFFDKDHNVVELVLGMMYREIKENKDEDKDEDKKEDKKEAKKTLLGKFHNAKLCLSQLSKDKVELYDPIDELEWLSGGLALKDKFQDLCAEFLKFTCGEMQGDKQSFLVIPIDDIDLNINGAYEMAEQIRKYLCAENCIILFSLNIDQFIEVVANYISKQVAPREYLGSTEMAQKYVTKLIPMEYRIMMPKPYNFCDQPFRYVVNEGEEKEYASVKEAVVRLIYNKTRYLFYNNKGSVSPIVPNNLRSLRHLIGMLAAMSDFTKNEETSNNKEDFKSYFYQVWTRQMDPESRKQVMNLVNVVDTTKVNKTVVNLLAPYLENIEDDRMAVGILEKDNYNYNVSVGDVFYLIDKIERSNVDEERDLVLFFIRSFYSIKLYENYDVITEQKGALYPNENNDEEIYKSGKWMKRTNVLQRLVNGAYFTYNPTDLIPMSTSPRMYRDTKVYSGMGMEFKEIFKGLADNLGRFDEMAEDDKADFKRKFRVAEFLALTTKRGIRQRDARNFSLAKRNVSLPYCLTNYQNTNYFVFDVMAPFYNIVNIAFSYAKFAPLISDEADEDKFFNFAKSQKWSLLNEMILEVSKKEYRDNHKEEMPEEELKKVCATDETMHRLMSNATIRNAEVLLAIMETMGSNRIRMHFGSGDSLEVIARFYQSIIDSEMRTYYSSATNKRYTIRFAFLNALIHVLKGDERNVLGVILESGPALVFNEYKDIENRFANFFSGFKTSKKAALIKKEMMAFYPSETQNLTDEDWKEMFPNVEKSVSRADILRAFSSKGGKLGLSD